MIREDAERLLGPAIGMSELAERGSKSSGHAPSHPQAPQYLPTGRLSRTGSSGWPTLPGSARTSRLANQPSSSLPVFHDLHGGEPGGCRLAGMLPAVAGGVASPMPAVRPRARSALTPGLPGTFHTRIRSPSRPGPPAVSHLRTRPPRSRSGPHGWYRNRPGRRKR